MVTSTSTKRPRSALYGTGNTERGLWSALLPGCTGLAAASVIPLNPRLCPEAPLALRAMAVPGGCTVRDRNHGRKRGADELVQAQSPQRGLRTVLTPRDGSPSPETSGRTHPWPPRGLPPPTGRQTLLSQYLLVPALRKAGRTRGSPQSPRVSLCLPAHRLRSVTRAPPTERSPRPPPPPPQLFPPALGAISIQKRPPTLARSHRGSLPSTEERERWMANQI